jgi:16S rRNA (uracil1498-N3)-methyltransferase
VIPDRQRFRPRFFLESEQALVEAPRSGDLVNLSQSDSRHARTVLRLRPGAACEVVLEPSGVIVMAEVVGTGPSVTLRVGDVLAEAAGPSLVEVVLVQSAPSPPKLDTVVEKGTEVGIDRFVLFPGDGSLHVTADKIRSRLPRLEKLAREAAKQSRQSHVPQVTVAAGLEEALACVAVHPEGSVRGAEDLQACSLVLDPAASISLREALSGLGDRRVVFLWVGSESGWSAAELHRLDAAGCLAVRLGRRVLRSETAGPVAAAAVRFALDDW